MGEKIIIKCVKVIEEKLKDPLSLHYIASQCGYSPYHFSRLFREEMGIGVMEYVKQRRLVRAAGEIRQGKRILDAALDYGYETHSGFTRAFTRQFGYSPALLRAFHVRNEYSKGGREMGTDIKKMDIHMSADELYAELLKTIEENGQECQEGRIGEVYKLSRKLYQGKKRYSGDEYVTHPLNVSIILADMGADEDTICAGLLHDVDDTKENAAAMERVISQDTKKILAELRQFDRYCSCKEQVVLTALADRLHNMRTIEFVDPETWKKRAEETLKIFSPIAAECKNFALKSELDELSLRNL